ncbi:MAG: hypothetical protein ACRDP5_04120 [Streptosporangiaceae bacterium]
MPARSERSGHWCDASNPGWWHRCDDVLPPWFRTAVGLEESVSLIRA